MDIMLEQYRTRMQMVKKRAPGTLLAFDKAARKFQQHLDALGRPALELTAWDLEDYLAGLDYADTTKRTHWIHIGGAYRLAHRRGQLTQDVTEAVYLAPPQKGVPKTIPLSDLRAMKSRLHTDREWLMWHLLTYTGMRQGEIRGLRWSDINLRDGSIELEQTKRGESRQVPIHPVLAEVLAEAPGHNGNYVVTTYGSAPVAYDTWIADLRRFGPGYTAHWFRRTFTSSLLDNEVEERVVKLIIGHTPQTVMGQFYDHRSFRVMQRAILKLYADDPV
jgi:integrase